METRTDCNKGKPVWRYFFGRNPIFFRCFGVLNGFRLDPARART